MLIWGLSHVEKQRAIISLRFFPVTECGGSDLGLPMGPALVVSPSGR